MRAPIVPLAKVKIDASEVIEQIDHILQLPRRPRLAVEARLPFGPRDLGVELVDIRQPCAGIDNRLDRLLELPSLDRLGCRQRQQLRPVMSGSSCVLHLPSTHFSREPWISRSLVSIVGKFIIIFSIRCSSGLAGF